MTFILLRANRDLATMYRALGLPTDEVNQWCDTLQEGCMSLLNPNLGYFNAINLRTGEHSAHLTSASFLCWYAGIQNAAMHSCLSRVLRDTTHPIPSLDDNSPDFDGLRYWRGPTWPILNALIGLGLSEMGHTHEAKVLCLKTRELILQNGFSEYFHPKTGAPGGGKAFTWTAAVWLAWASPSVGEK